MKYVLAVLVVVAAGAFLYIRYQTKDLNFDQAYVEALAARLLPGARPVAGTKGVIAADKELLEAAIMAPSLKKLKDEPLTGSELSIAVARIKQPPSDQQNIEKWRAFLDERKDVKRLESGPTMIQVGISGLGTPGGAWTSSFPINSSIAAWLKDASGPSTFTAICRSGNMNSVT